MRRTRISLTALIISLAALLGGVAPGAAQAQTDRRCFTETGHCIEGPIRAFWERNGGLPIFGLPTGPQGEEQIEGRALQTQWFERNRLELHPESPAPYAVQIGRLGADRLAQQGRDWFTFPKSEARAECRFFAETGHNVCGAILAAWRAQGLDLDGRRGASEAESLALFGLPLSDEQSETLADGRSYTVQWFERARIELHPENQPPYNVLLGLLGTELRGIAPAPPQPAPTPAPPPTGRLNLNGTWSGTTSQGQPFKLVISGGGLESFEIGYDDLGCGFSGTIGVSIAPPQPIAGNAFTYDSPPSYGGLNTVYTLKGVFRSSTAADGQLELTQSTSFPYVSCNESATITWTATKP